MSAQFISVHPDNPQERFIKKICEILQKGGVGVIPTDSAYAFCCMLEQKQAMERIARIRNVGKDHNFTLLCRDLSEISTYAKVNDNAYRLIKRHTPGAYTFILKATKEVPRRLMNEKRKTIGIRVPKNAILDAIVEELNAPLMSCSLILPGNEEAESSAVDINDKIGKLVDVIVDGGELSAKPTSVIVFDDDGFPTVAREGAGDTSDFV